MSTSTPRWLSDIISAARAGATAEDDLQIGPIPLRLGVEERSQLGDYRTSLAGSSAARWKPLEVRSVTSASMLLDGLPEPLRPIGDEVRRAQVGPTTIFVSGAARCTWILDAAQGLAVRWTPTDDDLPHWERIALGVATNWWAGENGAAILHAGAVAGPNGAVLLVGDSGAGKSTTTLACVGSGLDVLGDDYCLVQPPLGSRSPTGDDHPIVHATYRIAKLDERSLDLLPQLRERAVGPGLDGKTLLQLDDAQPGHHRVRAICQVVQNPTQPTHLAPTSRASVMRAAAPSTLHQLRRVAERTTWDVLARTTTAVSAHRLSVSDPAEVADALRSLL